MIIQGDCIEVLKTLPDNSVDSIVTDPPYELEFMGKGWDNTGIAYNVDMWREAIRVLKPGGHLLSFGGTRTYHRMAVAIEDAGFEIRDMIEWVYGSGFPKSLNIGKAVDKLQGNERETVREYETHDIRSAGLMDKKGAMTVSETKGTSPWEGWGTALKPAHEPICMARKPLAEKTVAENVLKYGTGGINIDESRVGTDELTPRNNNNTETLLKKGFEGEAKTIYPSPLGRFPANLIHDNSEEVRECFPETNPSKKGERNPNGRFHGLNAEVYGEHKSQPGLVTGHEDSGGNASRFFKAIIYTAKASKSERNKGCEGLETKDAGASMNTRCETCGKQKLDHEISRCKCEVHIPAEMKSKEGMKNNHPTVKPLALMEYLIKMVTPKGGVVLDPFAGSGSTLVAAKQSGYQYIGIEKEEEYIKIIEARLSSIVQGVLL